MNLSPSCDPISISLLVVPMGIGRVRSNHTGLVCTTSRRVRFIHVSQSTRWPLSVSPFLSSTSIGWPCAAFKSPRGNYRIGQSPIQRIGGRNCRSRRGITILKSSASQRQVTVCRWFPCLECGDATGGTSFWASSKRVGWSQR